MYFGLAREVILFKGMILGRTLLVCQLFDGENRLVAGKFAERPVRVLTRMGERHPAVGGQAHSPPPLGDDGGAVRQFVEHEGAHAHACRHQRGQISALEKRLIHLFERRVLRGSVRRTEPDVARYRRGSVECTVDVLNSGGIEKLEGELVAVERHRRGGVARASGVWLGTCCLSRLVDPSAEDDAENDQKCHNDDVALVQRTSSRSVVTSH